MGESRREHEDHGVGIGDEGAEAELPVLALDDRVAARLFDPATGKQLAHFAHDNTVRTVAFSPDGTVILTGSEDNTARLWRVFDTNQALVNAAKARAARCLTSSQREQYVLPPEPPLWCVERRLWPYHTDAWVQWLSARKAGQAPPTP